MNEVVDLVMSCCLTANPVEGGQVLSRRLLAEVSGPATVVLSNRDEPAEAGWLPLLPLGGLPLGALRVVRRTRPRRLLWVPDGGLTLLLVLRLALLHLLSPRTRIDVVLLQLFRAPRRWMAWAAGRSTRAVALNPQDQALLDAAGWRTRFLPPQASRDRVSTTCRTQARLALGLPLEATIHLHVGHATLARDLQDLAPLAALPGHLLVLVISPFSTPEPGAVPDGAVVVAEQVDVATWYRAADVYLFPTHRRLGAISQPMSVVEALANDLPVVARRSALTTLWEGRPDVHLVDDPAGLVERAVAVTGSTRGDTGAVAV